MEEFSFGNMQSRRKSFRAVQVLLLGTGLYGPYYLQRMIVQGRANPGSGFIV
jgi:hypothetical protein